MGEVRELFPLRTAVQVPGHDLQGDLDEELSEAMLALRRAANLMSDNDPLRRPMQRCAGILERRIVRRRLGGPLSTGGRR